MLKPYYKKIDRSVMEWGITIPQEYENEFLCNKNIKEGKGRDVDILWDGKRYPVKLRHINRTNFRNVYSLRWKNNKEFMRKLRRTFIHSYVVLKSQKELFDEDKKERQYFRTHLEGGKEEVLILTPLNSKTIKFEVFIKIKTEWNKLFQRLADENVFGWIFDTKEKQYLIQRSTNWIRAKEFNKHKSAINVIYYLANTKKKTLYIGKSNKSLGQRVKPGRQHQNMDGDGDLFKYDIIRPEFSNILERIEDHTIRTMAAILKNNKDYPTLGLSEYKLVNNNWKKL